MDKLVDEDAPEDVGFSTDDVDDDDDDDDVNTVLPSSSVEFFSSFPDSFDMSLAASSKVLQKNA